MAANSFDLAIIGSGSGNSIVGPDFDDWRIAIIEQSTFGGTCLNVGCIPTKMYVYPAELAESADQAARLGVDLSLNGVRWPAIRDRVFGRIDPISEGGRIHRRDGANTTLFEAHATFTGPHELSLSTGETITAERIVIAAGSRATVPPPVLDSGIHFHTSDTVMRIDALPKRVAILGSGYIACEFAHVFSAFGSETTVIARNNRLLSGMDSEVSTAFTTQVGTKWDLRLGSLPRTVTQAPDGTVRIGFADSPPIEADLLLVATGRRSNSDRLGLDAAGIAVHPDGRIVVDAQQRTTVANIWALGDVSAKHQLKHVANHEARVVAHNLAHPDAPVQSDHRFVPFAVFTSPQLASVGITEDEARARGRRYVSATQGYGSTAFGWAMEDTSSFCKVLADPDTGLLLGAHLLGPQAATLIQPLIQAMSFGLSAREMARGQYWIHPALTEVIENALLALDVG